jgi:hypothetical protein
LLRKKHSDPNFFLVGWEHIRGAEGIEFPAMDLTKELGIILANVGELVEGEDDGVVETHGWIYNNDMVLGEMCSQVLYAS